MSRVFRRICALFTIPRIDGSSSGVPLEGVTHREGITFFRVEMDDGRIIPCAVRARRKPISSEAEALLLRRVVLVSDGEGSLLEIEEPPKGEHCPLYLPEHLQVLRTLAQRGELPEFNSVQ